MMLVDLFGRYFLRVYDQTEQRVAILREHGLWKVSFWRITEGNVNYSKRREAARDESLYVIGPRMEHVGEDIACL